MFCILVRVLFFSPKKSKALTSETPGVMVIQGRKFIFFFCRVAYFHFCMCMSLMDCIVLVLQYSVLASELHGLIL